MGNETRSLISLKHIICPAVLGRQLEVRINVRLLDILVGEELTGASVLAVHGPGAAVIGHEVGAIHLAVVPHVFESIVAVLQVVISGKWPRSQRYGLLLAFD